mgnify:CR=1 FL=1
MDLKISYSIPPNKVESAMKKAHAKALTTIKGLVDDTVNNYLTELGEHMGVIPGDSAHVEGGVVWKKLDEYSLEKDRTFWYESGEAKDEIIVAVTSSGDSISAFAGIPSSSPAYQKVLWNEFGFTTKSGELIRRPLFEPLAEEHKQQLNERLGAMMRTLKLKIEVSV